MTKEKFFILAAVAVILLLFFNPFKKEIKCTSDKAQDRIGHSLTPTPAGESCSYGSTADEGDSPDGTITTEDDTTTDTVPPIIIDTTAEEDGYIPASYFDTSGIDVACTDSQSYYKFIIPNQAPPKSIGTQVISVTNKKGWDMWLKIVKVEPKNGLEITSSYITQYVPFKNGDKINISLDWFWNVSKTYIGDKGEATIYLKTVCNKPSNEELYLPVPDPPSGFRSENVTGTSGKLVWNSSKIATKYRVTNSSGFTVYEGPATEYTVTGLNYGTGYGYSLQAGNENGWSSKVGGSIVTTPNPLRPDTPILYVVSKTDTTITFGWNDVARADEYIFDKNWGTIYRGPNKTFTVTGLKPGEGAWFELAASNQYGQSDWRSLYATTDLVGDSQYPYVPQNLKIINITETSMTLQWDRVPKANSYRINLNQWNGKVLYSGNDTTVTINDLKPDTGYTFYLTALNDNYESAQSSVYGVTKKIVLPVPSVPSNFAASEIENSEMTLSWGAVSNANSYTLTLNGNTIYSGPNTSFRAIDLRPNTEYTFSVKANNDYGSSNWRTIKSSTANNRFDNTTDLNNQCSTNEFSKSFSIPTSAKAGTAGRVEIVVNNSSPSDISLKISSIDTFGSYFLGTEPVILDYLRTSYTIPANSSSPIPVTWTIPNGVDTTGKTGSFTVNLSTPCY